jgi:hypothetical protein
VGFEGSVRFYTLVFYVQGLELVFLLQGGGYSVVGHGRKDMYERWRVRLRGMCVGTFSSA